jgi:hypothetical protein
MTPAGDDPAGSALFVGAMILASALLIAAGIVRSWLTGEDVTTLARRLLLPERAVVPMSRLPVTLPPPRPLDRLSVLAVRGLSGRAPPISPRPRSSELASSSVIADVNRRQPSPPGPRLVESRRRETR